jgi:hypothetical protein
MFFARWNRDDAANCNWNNKGLNAIFIVVSPNEFKRISMSLKLPMRELNQ